MKSALQLSFRAKLLILVALISGLAIVLATGATTTLDYIWSRQASVRAVTSHADVIASNSAAAVVFNDPNAATETLKALHAIPGITAANIYDDAGNIFATYSDGSGPPPAPDNAKYLGHVFSETYMDLSRAIELEGERVGVITLRYDMSHVHSRVMGEVLVSICCALAAMLLAFLLAVKLQNSLTRPVVELEAIAREVAHSRDYSVRAHKYSSDELGSLTDSFNEMLTQVQSRDTALAQARDRLEDEVAERTRELETAKSVAERAAESLVDSETRIRTILEQAPDGVITFDVSGKISLMNPAAETIFARSFRELNGLAMNDLLDKPYTITDDGQIQHRQSDDTLLQLGQSAEIYGLCRDGRKVPIQVSLSRTNLGGRDTFTAIIRDITERVQAEKEKEHLNRRLLEESRRSGMAEIATGVLHNVGNVLTSISVSVNLLNSRLDQSKVSSLVKAAQMIREHEDNLADFIRNDDRGKHLPRFIVQVSEHLSGELNDQMRELSSLIEQTHHIQEIINTQQTYATSGGMVEKVVMEEVLQDALRINEAGMERHNIKLRLEVGDLPHVYIDKHKVLQVLVNLISNAKYAADHSKPEPSIMIRICTDGSDSKTIRIEVADNGIGIPKENLVRIFNHGFTTRSDGHGFGLHNAALVAKEMGGSLTAASPGPGHGATFTLTFPTKPGNTREEAQRDSAA